MNTPQPKIGQAISVGLLFAFVMLLGQLVAWATDACQIPNPSTVFCTAKPPDGVSDCKGLTQLACPNRKIYDRKQFPQGGAKSDSGTTKQEEDDCIRYESCIWDPNSGACNPDTNWSPYSPGDKTVVGEAQCPTEEGK